MDDRSLIQRLQGRRMLQWIIAYAAVAWGVAEATGFAIDNYGLSRTLLDVVLFLLLVSLLALIVLVWFHGLRGRQRVTRVEAALLGTLLISAVGGSLWLAAGRVDAAAASTEDAVAVELGDNAIAVLPFRSSVGDRELAWLARGIPELVSIQLARMDGFRVVSGQRVFDVLRQLDVAEDSDMPAGLEQRVTRLSGAHLAVSGSVFGGPGDLAIAATLSDVGTGEILASAETRGSDVFDLVDEVSRSLRVQLGDAPETDARTTALLTTGSVEAYRAYEQGRQAALRFQPQEAATHLRRAVGIDPSFALAHFRLALALFSLGESLEAT